MGKIKEVFSYIVWKLLFLVTGIIIGLIIAIFIKIETIVPLLLPIIVGVSALVAILSLKQHENINKENKEKESRSVALKDINSHIKNLEIYRTELDKITTLNKMIVDDKSHHMSFTTRYFENSPLEKDEVHKWVCIDPKISGKLCKMTEEGSNVVNLLKSVINTYEIIAIGVSENILSKDLVIKMMKNSLLKNFNFYKDYIYHLRDKHGQKNLGSSWENLCKDLDES